jgi:ubiquinone biosynthesis protein UbiJ
MAEDYTYTATLPPKTGTQMLHEELDALREQVAKLTRRVDALEAQRKPQPVALNVVYDWED